MNPNEQNNNQIDQPTIMQPTASVAQAENTPMTNPQPKKSKKTTLWVVIALLFVIGVAATSFFLMKDSDDTNKTSSNSSTNSSSNSVSNTSNTNNSGDTIAIKAHNLERETDIKGLSFSLEEYYVKNGAYPSLEELNLAAWLSSNMPGLSVNFLKDPSTSDPEIIGTMPTKVGNYAYIATPKGCSSSLTNPCEHYTLAAFREGTEAVYVRQSLN